MRMLQRFNPGPGLADFWAEFKRPNPYRWPILGISALLTGALLYLLSDHAVNLNWVAGGVLALIVGVVLVALIHEHVKPNWSVAVVAAALTGIIMYQFTKEKVRIPPPPPDVTYITTFEPGRTDAEILASNRENQARQDELRRIEEERAEFRRSLYRELGRATGIDVDRMEREIRAEEAQEAAAARARRAEPAGGTVERPEQ